MRKRAKLYITLILLIIAVVVFQLTLRRERITVGMHRIVYVRDEGDSFVVEYRGYAPFEFRIDHSLQTAGEPSSEPGVHIGQVGTYRTEEVVTFSSRYDWIRDEHVVRLRMTRGKELAIQCGSKTVRVSPWLVPDASETRWATGGTSRLPSGELVFLLGGLGEGSLIGDRCGDHGAHLARTETQHEFLMFTALYDVAAEAQARQRRKGREDDW